MKLNINKKSLLLFSVFVLFLIRLLFYYNILQFNTAEIYFSAAEFFLFFCFVITVVTKATLLVRWICAGLWIIILGLIGGFVFGFGNDKFNIIPTFVVFLPVCLFVLLQSKSEKTHTKELLDLFVYIFPVFNLGIIVFQAIKTPGNINRVLSSGYNYDCVLFSVLIVLYGIILTKGLSAVEKKQRRKSRETSKYYIFAMISMVESFVLLRMYDILSLSHSVALFWLVDLIILFEQKNLLIVSSCERLCTTIKKSFEQKAEQDNKIFKP